MGIAPHCSARLNDKVVFLEKLGVRPANSTGAWELDPSLAVCLSIAIGLLYVAHIFGIE